MDTTANDAGKLTDDAIEAAVSTGVEPGKSYRKIADGRGLFLLIQRSGRPSWRLKFFVNGVEGSTSFGTWPRVSLDEARDKATEARKLVRADKNPAAVKREKRAAAHVAAVTTFAIVAEQYMATVDVQPRTKKKHAWIFGLLKTLHAKPLHEITTPMIYGICQRLENNDMREAAHRAAQFAGAVIRHAARTGQFPSTMPNPAQNIRGGLKSKGTEAHPAIVDPETFGLLMRVIDSGHGLNDDGHGLGHPTACHALQLLVRTALRHSELRLAHWSEINFDKAEWIVPAARMKSRRLRPMPHLVPLSTQCLAILRAQHAITGDGPLIFLGHRTGEPLSDGTLNKMLALIFPRSMVKPHGFRSSFSTLLNERGVDSSLIELQLSHGKRDAVAGIYDRSQRVPERRKLMQDYSDLIDELRGIPAWWGQA